MNEIELIKDGIKYIVKDYEIVGPKLGGMSSDKIFYDNGSYYKNENGQLIKIKDFEIYKGNEKISPDQIVFDTNVRVAAALISENKLLLIHRIKDGREYYVYPGGHIKQNEDYMQAIIREVKEETNLDISNLRVDHLMDIDEEGFGPEKFYTIKLSSIDENINTDNPEDTKDVSELIWINIGDARNLKNLFPQQIIGNLK